MIRYIIPFTVTLVVGCSGTTPSGQEPTASTSRPSTETGPPASSSSASVDVFKRIAVLEELGFERDHIGDDYVQYVRGTLIVDLDLDGDGIHVTPIDESATQRTDEMVESALRVYDALGIPIRGLTYDITRSDGVGPEIHRTEIGGWNVKMRHWPKGIGGMFVAFSVERQ